MKKISVLGSTGSIGVNTLAVAEKYSKQFEIVALAGGSNIEVLAEQINKFRPKLVSVLNPEQIDPLKKVIKGTSPEILSGQEGAIAVATVKEADMVVSAIVGGAGLLPTYAAIQKGKDIALANKETLVIAGELVIEATKGKCKIFGALYTKVYDSLWSIDDFACASSSFIHGLKDRIFDGIKSFISPFQ